MPLVTLRDVALSYGTHMCLQNLNLMIDENERACLVGRNGVGKSTLLKLISREIKPDSGLVSHQKNLRIASLVQEVPQTMSGKVFDIVAGGFEDYESQEDWQTRYKIESVLTQMHLSGDTEFAALSGGLKRRVLLARAIVNDPQLLILDEPTNHLDIESITWLENFLIRYKASILFVTHDRAFLQNVATCIIDLDRGQLTRWECDYQSYLQRKEAMLAAEATEWALFDKKLAQEEVWIRQGIKARRTRNEGRVRALEALRETRKQRRNRIGKVNLQTSMVEKSGKIVIEAENLTFKYEGKSIVNDFSTTIVRGDKIGIIGPNGVGKTTLIRLLLNEITPDKGTVKHGTQLTVAYYDQLRANLDENKSVIDNVGGGSTAVTINGESKHIMSYLQDFLFTPDRVRTPITALSGGERNRVMLAQLFAKSFNVLVMDEPTNDLDIETLDLLEELLIEYKGTLLLVSHDRAFLNNVVTSTFVFDEGGTVTEYVGGYDDWLAQRPSLSLNAREKHALANTAVETKKVNAKSSRKLNYKEQRELDELPKRIELLEQEISQCQQTMLSNEFYQQSKEMIADAAKKLEALQQQLKLAYERWELLENT